MLAYGRYYRFLISISFLIAYLPPFILYTNEIVFESRDIKKSFSAEDLNPIYLNSSFVSKNKPSYSLLIYFKIFKSEQHSSFACEEHS